MDFSFGDFDAVAWATDLVIAHGPRAASALGVLIAGAILARIGRSLSERALERIDVPGRLRALGEGAPGPRVMAYAERAPDWGGRLARALILAASFYVIADIVKFEALSVFIGSAVALLPSLVTSAAILGVGLLSAQFLGRVVTRTLGERGAVARATGELVRVAVLAVGALMAAQQLGLEVALMNALFIAASAALAIGVVGALCAGALGPAREVLAGWTLRRALSEGDVLTVAGHDATLSSFGLTVMILRREDDARIVVPYTLVLDAPIRRRAR